MLSPVNPHLGQGQTSFSVVLTGFTQALTGFTLTGFTAAGGELLFTAGTGCGNFGAAVVAAVLSAELLFSDDFSDFF